MKLQTLSWLAGLLGFGLLVSGVAVIHWPAAMILAGILLLFWAKLADQAAAKQKGGGG